MSQKCSGAGEEGEQKEEEVGGREEKEKEKEKRQLKTFLCSHCPIQCSASGKEASGKARSKVELAGSLLTA